MSDGRSLLAVFAHPDDESVNMGGTLARYASEGVEISLLCATSGEWGTIADPRLASRENLGTTREAELRAACAILGVEWIRFLDCTDGGLKTAVWPVVEEKIVRYIRKRRPQVVVTFGPDGMYGHDDHIAISMLTAAAFKSAAEERVFPEHLESGLRPHRAERLYYVEIPRALMRNAVAAVTAEHPGAHLWELPPEEFGVPCEAITTEIDVSAFVERKIEALRCHRTQLDADNLYRVIKPAEARRFFGREYFRRASPPLATAELETSLF